MPYMTTRCICFSCLNRSPAKATCERCAGTGHVIQVTHYRGKRELSEEEQAILNQLIESVISSEQKELGDDDL